MGIQWNWKKLDLLFTLDALHPKLHSHASNPLPIHLYDDVYRFFYSGRDRQNRSSVSFVDIDILKRVVVYTHPVPIFLHGEPGEFYSHGVSIGCYHSLDGNDYLFFMGWQYPNNQHWKGEIGCVQLINNQVPKLESPKLVLSLDTEDPISLSYPCILFERGTYKMWYGSTITWETDNGEMLHVIKYATSVDGRTWEKQGLAIPYELGVAQAFSKPTVIRNKEGYHMWFSYRGGLGRKYRLGYSYSEDSIKWSKVVLNPGISISNSGWDSEMIEYPFVFNHKGKYFMVYNGNSYGKTGFGIAVLY
ncbi:hypothetical protein AY599_17295 [Leptolyngbya valderiana BDU 20041]|nr:hypothetical protein AY599_17295 [Leptolyngbya valderiana BDU 20041]